MAEYMWIKRTFSYCASSVISGCLFKQAWGGVILCVDIMCVGILHTPRTPGFLDRSGDPVLAFVILLPLMRVATAVTPART